MNSVRPDTIVKWVASGIDLGGIPYIACLTCLIYSGLVPQQPPTILSKPSSANPLIASANISGVSSYPPIALGRPAFGYAWTLVVAILESL
jgi:hypothetical protein